MQIDVNKLKGKIIENRMTLAEFAEKIGLDVSTLHRKFNAEGQSFSIGQMHGAVEALHLSETDAKDIFLPMYSHKCEISLSSKSSEA